MKHMPMLLVAGRLNHALLDAGLRHLTSTVVISGEVVDSHACATLIGYGVNAIYPYLLYASVLEIAKKREQTVYELKQSLKNVHQALGLGILKIMSKMGIATVASYRNSALFDVIGLDKQIVKECFRDSHALILVLDIKIWKRESTETMIRLSRY
jgi:glutamate synthase (NADPH/NADH) large chain